MDIVEGRAATAMVPVGAPQGLETAAPPAATLEVSIGYLFGSPIDTYPTRFGRFR